MNDNYDDLYPNTRGADTGLSMGAGALRGALGVVLPWLDRHQQAKDAENLQAWKQTRKQILDRLDEIDRYEQLSERKGRGKVKLFDPQKNKDHEAIARFLTDRTPMTDKQFRSFMDIQTPLEGLLDDEEAQGSSDSLANAENDSQGAEDKSLSLGVGDPQQAVESTKLGAAPSLDPTAGNMYGDATASQLGGKLDTVTLPGGQLAEAPTTPGEVLVPPNGGPPVQGNDLLSTVRQNREARKGRFQAPAEGVPDREEGKTLLQRLHARGWDVKLDKNFTLKGMSFKERTSRRADDVLGKYAQGVPWSEAIEGAGAEAQKLARPIAEQILRADLAKRGLSGAQIDQAVASEFGEMSELDKYGAKADIEQRSRLRYAEPIAGASERGRRDARLETPIDEKERDSAEANQLFPGNVEAQNAYIMGLRRTRKSVESQAAEEGRRKGARNYPNTKEEITIEDARAAAGGAPTAGSIATIEGKAEAGKEGIIEKAKLNREARRPVSPDERRTWFARDTGDNPPMRTPVGRLTGKLKSGKKTERYVKLSAEQGKLVHASKRMMRQFYVLRNKLDRFFESDAPLINYIEGKSKEWGDLDRDIAVFSAMIGDVAGTYGGEGRRLTEEDRKQFKKLLGIDSKYVNKKKLMQVYDDLETKLANDIRDVGLEPSAVGVRGEIRYTAKPSGDRYIVTPVE